MRMLEPRPAHESNLLVGKILVGMGLMYVITSGMVVAQNPGWI